AGPGVLTLSGGLSGSAGVTLAKDGPGTMVLGGASDYPGTTEIDAGTLQVDGTLLPTGQVQLLGGTLAGTGSVRALTAQSVVAPGHGAGPGILTASSVTFGPGGRFGVTLNGPTPGTDFAQLVSNGPVALQGAGGNPANFPVLAVTLGAGPQSAVGAKF